MMVLQIRQILDENVVTIEKYRKSLHYGQKPEKYNFVFVDNRNGHNR